MAPTIMAFCFSSINVGLPFLQIDCLSVNPKQYALSKVFWALGMLLSSGFLIKNLRKEARLKTISNSIFLLSLLTLLFDLFLLSTKIPILLSLILFNFFFAAVLVRYRVGLSINTLNHFVEEELNQIISRQKNYDQLLRAFGVVIFGFLYDKFPYLEIFLATSLLMLTAGIIFKIFSSFENRA